MEPETESAVVTSPEVVAEILTPAPQPEPPVEMPVAAAAPELTVIGATMVIQGEIYCDEGIRVYGRVEGALHATGSCVVIEPEGSVKASVTADEVIVRGRLEGDTVASASITVCRDGRLTGEARTARLVVEDGAFVKGKNETGGEVKPRKPANGAKPSARKRVPQV